MSRKMAAKHRFKLQKLDRPVTVRNVNRTNNNRGAIIYQVKVNVYYKSHIKRMGINICNLWRTDIILEIPWLQVYNLKINQETEEVKITKYLLLCEKNTKLKEEQKVKKRKRVVILKKEKIVRQAIDDKKDWETENEIETDHRKIKKIVPKKFLQ